MAKSPVRSSKKSATFNRPVKDYAPAPLEDKEPEPNFDLLSEEDKDALRKKAAAKVDAAEITRAMDAYLEAEIARIERERHPEAFEEEQDVKIDLAIYANMIILDGRRYVHGKIYKVKKRVGDVMRDIMSQTFKHYRSTHRDPTAEFYNAQRAITKEGPGYATINGSTGQVTKF